MFNQTKVFEVSKKVVVIFIGLSLVLWSLGGLFLFSVPPAKAAISPYPGDVVISEVQTSSTSSASHDFIELYNPRQEAIDLNGCRLVKRSKIDTADRKIADWSSLVTIPAHGFYLWAHSDYTELSVPDNSDRQTTYQTLEDDNSIALKCGTMLIDGLAWGTGHTASLGEGIAFSTNPSAGQSLERKAFPVSSASDMASGGADETLGNSEDSENNGNDFVLQTSPNPQGTMDTPESPPGAMGGVIINEVALNWVELLNASPNQTSISGYQVKVKNETYTISSAVPTMPPHSFVVVNWARAGTNETSFTADDNPNDLNIYTGTTNFSNVNLTSSTDVLLRDSANNISDYVQIGAASQPNEAAAVAASPSQWTSGATVTSTTATSSSIKRTYDGMDTNQVSDWSEAVSPTKGFYNAAGGDFEPPTVTTLVLDSAVDPSNRTVSITFSEALKAFTANDTTNYSIAGNSVISAFLQSGAKIVKVVFDYPLSPMTIVDISGVQDVAGNTMAPASPSIGGASLAIGTDFLPSAMKDQSYESWLWASGGTPPFTWSIASGSLPAGLSLTATGMDAGKISGIPTAAAGDYPITFKVVDSASPAASATRAFPNFKVIATSGGGADDTPPTLPSPLILYPVADEVFFGGQYLTVSWDTNITDDESGLAMYPIEIESSPTGAAPWMSLGSGLENSGNFDVWLPESASSTGAKIKIKVSDVTGNIASSTSAAFTIHPVGGAGDTEPPVINDAYSTKNNEVWY